MIILHTLPVKARWLAVLMMVCIVIITLSVPALAAGQRLVIHNADIFLTRGVYHLDADVEYSLTRQLAEALSNGVGLIFDMQIEVIEVHEWRPNTEVASITQRNRLAFHALSRQFVVENLNTNVLETFPDLTSALRYQGRVRDLPVLDATLLDEDSEYRVRVRVDLARNELPLPLRARGYFSNAWQLSSDWREWELR